MNNRLLAFLLVLLTVSGAAMAIEGKWTPQQILELDPAWLRAQGLQVAPDTLWSREGGGPPGLGAAWVPAVSRAATLSRRCPFFRPLTPCKGGT